MEAKCSSETPLSTYKIVVGFQIVIFRIDPDDGSGKFY
jgi:hypothetical protein